MTPREDVLEWVEELEAASLTRTALNVLNDAGEREQISGDRAYCMSLRLQQKATLPRIAPAVYILVCFDVGVPLRIEARAGAFCDPSLRPDAVAAWFNAQKAARSRMPPGSSIFTTTVPVIYPLRSLDGSSLGLGAAIAILAYLTGRSPRVPILCTGTIGPDGHVGPVSQLPEKVAAALRELEGTAGRVLICAAQKDEVAESPHIIPVHTLDEACREVFGADALFPQETLIYLEDRLKEIMRIADHTEAMRQLSMIPLDNYNRTDQARILLYLGSRSRHMGNPAKASEYHDRWQRLSADVRIEQGDGMLETMETEVIATELDQYRLGEMETWLRDRLERPMQLAHNMVRYRGMLAQVLSMTGRNSEAVQLRRRNLEVQEEGGESMRFEIPRTLSYAVFESARGGDGDSFDAFLAQLLRETRLYDETQHRYNALNILRGLLLLKRNDAALRWIEQSDDPPARLIQRLIQGKDAVVLHPEISILRALARLFRRVGKTAESVGFCDRVNTERMDPMAAWYGASAMAEKGLALLDMTRREEALRTLLETADFLRQIYAPLAEFHAGLITLLRASEPDVAAIEAALDQLYY